MKKIIVAGTLSLTCCVEDDRIRSDGIGVFDPSEGAL